MNLLFLPLLLAPSQDHAPYPGAEVRSLVREGRYLAAMDAALFLADEEPGSMSLDLLGLTQSYLGLERETAETFDRMAGSFRAAIASSPLDEAEASDAVRAIVEAAKWRKVVILNESHHMPRHRAFALELARALRAEGFDTFAAETFAGIDKTVELGHPTVDTGYYTVEPVFAQLVRGVIELDYELVAYEWQPTGPMDPTADPRARINQRETAQAKNLYERVFEKNPDARLFVYVGYSHATENWEDPGGENEQAWMAARLADLTGFDPLTIDQTTGMPRSNPKYEDPHWRRADERGVLDGPKVFRTGDEGFFVTGNYAGKVDMQVFHPRTELRHGRPDWLHAGREVVAPPDELLHDLPEGEPVLLQAFPISEGPKATIPADQFVWESGGEAPRFLLPKGAYRFAAQNVAGDTLAKHARHDV